MSDDITDRARAALEGVTDGPWEVNREGWAVISSSSDSVLHGYFEGDCDNCCYPITAAASVAIGIENVTFIAEARTLVPELLAEVERLRGGRSNHEALMASAGEQYDKLAVEVERLRGALDRLAGKWESDARVDPMGITFTHIDAIRAVLRGDQ